MDAFATVFRSREPPEQHRSGFVVERLNPMHFSRATPPEVGLDSRSRPRDSSKFCPKSDAVLPRTGALWMCSRGRSERDEWPSGTESAARQVTRKGDRDTGRIRLRLSRQMISNRAEVEPARGTVQSSASRRCFGASGRTRHGRLRSRPMRTYGIFRASIPSFFIRVSRVVRFRPKRAAAPFGPPTCPLVSFRIRTIVFCSSEFLAVAGADLAPWFANSGTEMAKVLLRVRITARSTRF
jgi:hypothetical protein